MAGWTVWLDQPITRRKAFHVVTDDQGKVTYRSRHLTDCLEHLDAMGETVYLLVPLEPPSGRAPLQIEAESKQRKWQKLTHPSCPSVDVDKSVKA